MSKSVWAESAVPIVVHGPCHESEPLTVAVPEPVGRNTREVAAGDVVHGPVHVDAEPATGRQRIGDRRRAGRARCSPSGRRRSCSVRCSSTSRGSRIEVRVASGVICKSTVTEESPEFGTTTPATVVSR